MNIPPGSTIGILGGGQLGRMLAVAAAQLGYRSHIYAPGASGPATEVAAEWTQGAYDDRAALARFGDVVDVITFEFENVALAALEMLTDHAPLRPGARSLAMSQDRADEKRFVESVGGNPAPWHPVDSLDELIAAFDALGAPAILKTRRLGYDGRGQARIASTADLDSAWEAIGKQPAVLEAMITFDAEFSVILCRGKDGEIRIWDSPVNVHEKGILASSRLPAPPALARQIDLARAVSRDIAEALSHVGVLTVEFFACTGGPLVNEFAPRVHNSGHWTIEGSVTSQFENHIRAICGLPLGDTAMTGPRVEMLNLIGEEAEQWPKILSDPAAHLHLYGKSDARPGRKMGHVTRVTK